MNKILDKLSRDIQEGLRNSQSCRAQMEIDKLEARLNYLHAHKVAPYEFPYKEGSDVET